VDSIVEAQSRSRVSRLQNADSPEQRRLLFDELMAEHGASAYRYAFALLGDAQWAEDATQEAFLTVYRQIHQLRQPEAFAGWLRRIVHSQCHRLLRARDNTAAMCQLPDQVPAAQPLPEHLVEQQELQERVWAAIASLPETERTPVALYYLDGQPQRQIASDLDLSLAAVKKRLERARHRLAERIGALAQEYRHTTTRSNTPAPDSLSTLLGAAALEGQYVLLETLLVEGMDVNEADANGETLLHWAAREGHLDAVELLLSYHPDLARPDASGRTALDVAMAAGQRSVAARLRQYAQTNPSRRP
jgi:RNA polymerase sigma factor (sigma-70 family)